MGGGNFDNLNLKPLNPFFDGLGIIANRLDFGLFHTVLLRDFATFRLFPLT